MQIMIPVFAVETLDHEDLEIKKFVRRKKTYLCLVDDVLVVGGAAVAVKIIKCLIIPILVIVIFFLILQLTALRQSAVSTVASEVKF